MPKTRLDELLFEQGLAPSVERARALIMAARVMVNEQKVEKPGTKVADDATLRVLGEEPPYVSRGGIKLAHAVTTFQPQLTGIVAMDVGASTGGFTDCLLQHGVSKVYAVDVGYGQLAEKLRQDPRVINMERTNIRELESLPEPVQLVVIDASFISLAMVLPAAVALLASGGHVIALVKPQFEVGKGEVEKGGVVTDPLLHESVVKAVSATCAELGLAVLGVTPSPITGAKKGNIEFLLYAQKP